jgi:hypothetical protein
MWIESTSGHSIVNMCAMKICVTSKLNQTLTFEYAIKSCYQHIDLFVWYLILFDNIYMLTRKTSSSCKEY